MNTRMIPDSKPINVGETGIQAAIRIKEAKSMMKERAEAMMEANAIRRK